MASFNSLTVPFAAQPGLILCSPSHQCNATRMTSTLNTANTASTNKMATPPASVHELVDGAMDVEPAEAGMLKASEAFTITGPFESKASFTTDKYTETPTATATGPTSSIAAPSNSAVCSSSNVHTEAPTSDTASFHIPKGSSAASLFWAKRSFFPHQPAEEAEWVEKFAGHDVQELKQRLRDSKAELEGLSKRDRVVGSKVLSELEYREGMCRSFFAMVTSLSKEQKERESPLRLQVLQGWREGWIHWKELYEERREEHRKLEMEQQYLMKVLRRVGM